MHLDRLSLLWLLNCLEAGLDLGEPLEIEVLRENIANILSSALPVDGVFSMMIDLKDEL